MNRKLFTIVAVIVVLFGAAYLGSPYLAARQFKQAAISGDVDQLDTAVDFPAVRESLKSQLTVALTAKMATDPSMKSNPFSALGALMMPALINRMVDGFVTPEGISAMVKRGKVEHHAEGTQTEKPKVEYEYNYRTLDRFAVTVRGKDAKVSDAPAFVFARQGLFSWRLIRLEIPTPVFDNK